MVGRTLQIAILTAGFVEIALSTSSAGATAAGRTRGARPISPGEASGEVQIATSCPTFSWSSPIEEGESEIALFEIGEESGRVEPTLVLTRRFVVGATSWTPARADCLRAGGRYAWVVRSVGGEAGASGEWSEARRFAVPGAAGEEEVAAALEVLRRHFEGAGSAAGASASSGGESRRSGSALTRSVLSSTRSPAGVTGSAAIQGELAATSGEAYGVLGLSNSVAGAGLAARNAANGADLRLDGSAAGATDLDLTEGGLDRNSPGTESFNIQNSGAGSMVLQVDGESVLTASALQWNGIANIPAGFADGVDDDTLYAAGNQLQLSGGTFDVTEGPGSGLDADTFDALDSSDFVTTSSLTWASVRRKFYLTENTFTGSQVLSAPACAAGFHMASLWEIFDVSGLAYLQAPGVASTTADAGFGPPTLVAGWIRTGFGSDSSGVIGLANCSAWSSNSGNGTVVSVGLAQGWQDYQNDDGLFENLRRLPPWTPAIASCSTPLKAWCVED